MPMLVAALTLAAAPAGLTVDNLEPGLVLRNPVAVIRGSAPGQAVRYRNANSPDPDARGEAPTAEGRYVALVPLSPGTNRIRLESAGASRTVEIAYRPANTPYKVRVVYVTGQEGDTRFETPNPQDQDYRSRLDVAARLMQAFTAEQMRARGYGPKTFAVDLDRNGRVKVETLAYPLPADELRKKDGGELWGLFYGWLDKRFPFSRNKCLVIMGFTAYDRKERKALAHTALGGGGEALFGGATIHSWPRSLREVSRVFLDATPVDPALMLDDSAYRGTLWGLAATTIGACLHELGHTFGLPHIDDPLDIMSRGFDRINRFFAPYEPPSGRNKEPIFFGPDQKAHWSPYFAAQLSVSRWFQPDACAFRDADPPKVEAKDGRVAIEAKNGLALVCAQQGDPVGPRWFRAVSGDRLELPVQGLRAKMGAQGGPIRVLAFDREGNSASVEVP